MSDNIWGIHTVLYGVNKPEEHNLGWERKGDISRRVGGRGEYDQNIFHEILKELLKYEKETHELLKYLFSTSVSFISLSTRPHLISQCHP